MMERLINGLEERNLPNDPKRIEQVREWILADGDIELNAHIQTLTPYEQKLSPQVMKEPALGLKLAYKVGEVTSEYPDDLPAATLRFWNRTTMPDWMTFFTEAPASWNELMKEVTRGEAREMMQALQEAAKKIGATRGRLGRSDIWIDCTIADLRNLQILVDPRDISMREAFIKVAFPNVEDSK